MFFAYTKPNCYGICGGNVCAFSSAMISSLQFVLGQRVLLASVEAIQTSKKGCSSWQAVLGFQMMDFMFISMRFYEVMISKDPVW